MSGKSAYRNRIQVSGPINPGSILYRVLELIAREIAKELVKKADQSSDYSESSEKE